MDMLDRLFAKIDRMQKLGGKDNKQSVVSPNEVSSTKEKNAWWRTSIESSGAELNAWQLMCLYNKLRYFKLRTKENADSIKQS